VESSCECGNEPSGIIKCWEASTWPHYKCPAPSPKELVSEKCEWSFTRSNNGKKRNTLARRKSNGMNFILFAETGIILHYKQQSKKA
jgi:hypothetical protein